MHRDEKILLAIIKKFINNLECLKLQKAAKFHFEIIFHLPQKKIIF
jgi:hypothetical protein